MGLNFNDNELEKYIEDMSNKFKYDEKKEFSDNTIKKDFDEFKETRKNLEEPDPVVYDDRIFKRLATDDELKKANDI